jgi:hypothetical protein
MVVDLPKYSLIANGVDGIIGLDLLSRSDKFTNDYSQRRLHFELAAPGSARQVPGCFVVPIVVQGLVIHLGVDTGVSGIVLQFVQLFVMRTRRREAKIIQRCPRPLLPITARFTERAAVLDVAMSAINRTSGL